MYFLEQVEDFFNLCEVHCARTVWPDSCEMALGLNPKCSQNIRQKVLITWDKSSSETKETSSPNFVGEI